MTLWPITTLILAYRPILDPLPVERAWPLLLLPPVLAVAAVYKCIKIQDLKSLRWEVLRMSGQIVAFVIGSAVFLWALTQWV